jgi:Legionella pneumophila major outer membrane protein precursor
MRRLLLLALGTASLLSANIGGSWLYLQPTQSDGDLEVGSLITLTGDDPNLNAFLLENRPDHASAFELFAGYCGVQARYMYFNGSASSFAETVSENQLIQNFLGFNYDTASASSRYRVHDVDLTYGFGFGCLRPFAGVEFADIRRTLDVSYVGETASVAGKERSEYWGVGPTLGVEAARPIFCGVSAKGRFAAGFLFGNRRASLDSAGVFEASPISFSASNSSSPVVTALKCDLALSYEQPVCGGALELQLGYRADYYFEPIERINPLNGYVVDLFTRPFGRSANLGLHGPYLSLAFNECPSPRCCDPISFCEDVGFRFEFINSWLLPTPTHGDLQYGFVEETGRTLKVDPDFNWAGTYVFTFMFGCHDLEARYFHLGAGASDAVRTPDISSRDASGDPESLFGAARSHAGYEINQVDLTLGRWMPLYCIDWRGSVGLRYVDLKRRQDKGYTDGVPDANFASKFPILRSHYWGVGPTVGIDPRWCLCGGLSLRGEFDFTLAIGDLRATVDQQNIGTETAHSSNDMRTPRIATMVPIVDVRLGANYEHQFSCVGVELGAGYQFTEYFKAINLLFPNLLVGLEQNNNDLMLSGPYLSLGLSTCF